MPAFMSGTFNMLFQAIGRQYVCETTNFGLIDKIHMDVVVTNQEQFAL